jgi:hypothetical protein
MANEPGYGYSNTTIVTRTGTTTNQQYNDDPRSNMLNNHDQASQSGSGGIETKPPVVQAVPTSSRMVHEDSGRRFRPNQGQTAEEIPPDYSPD